MNDSEWSKYIALARQWRQQLWTNGYSPVPIRNGKKFPSEKRWPERARAGEFANAIPDRDHLGIGIECSGLRAVDFDIDDEAIAADVTRLAGEILGAPAAARYRDNSPRRIWLYRANEGNPPKRTIKGTRGTVEVLGRGQQFVAIGTHPSKAPYAWNPSLCPRDALSVVTEQQIDRLFEEIAPIIAATPKAQPSRLGRDRQCAKTDCDALIERIKAGDQWHDNTLRLTGHWVAMKRTDEEILAWAEPLTLPEYAVDQTRSELQAMIDGARKKGFDQTRRGSPGSGDTDSVDKIIAEFNSKYLVVNEAGKAVIFEPKSDPTLRRRYYTRITFNDFRRLFLNRRLPLGDRMETAANIWLDHPDRRQYINGVIFDPSERDSDPGTLNLWSGFAVEPRPGDWSLLKDHIRQIICGDSRDALDYLIGWMAQLVQHPAEQGHTAVVMKGGEGTGKGILARALLHILGQHGLAISNAKHLIGNFNAHLRDIILLFADEAFFAGDRAHVGVLKSLITEPTLTIEGKYQNAVQVPNFLHVMMASNEEWVVPAGLDARRFLVLVVSEARKRDHSYFQAITDQLNAGGHEAMLFDLLHYDVSAFNARVLPVTEGLQEQRKLSLPVAELWWMDVLHRGFVQAAPVDSAWIETISTETLFSNYSEFAKQRNERHPLSREAFGRFMKRMGARPRRLSGTSNEAPIGPIGQPTCVNPTRRPYGYHLGNLDRARTEFCAATGLTFEWPADEEKTAPDAKFDKITP